MEFFRHRRQATMVAPNDRSAAFRAADPVGPPDQRGAYVAGVREGRLDERRRRRGHPVLGLVVGLVAVAGAAFLALAVREGSFSRGGQVVDQKLTAAADEAKAAGQTAAVKTGQAIETAGETIEHKAAGANGQNP